MIAPIIKQEQLFIKYILLNISKIPQRPLTEGKWLEWAVFRGGTGSYCVIRSLDVIGPMFQPEQAIIVAVTLPEREK
jgi:hypothetical protein